MNSTKKKDQAMSDVLSVVEIILHHPHAQIIQTLYTQPGVTYAEISIC
jgi:hypothetical protein